MRFWTAGGAVLVLQLAAFGHATASEPATPEPAAARSIFERRILPIFRADKPSSCAECHLSGVDLKDYIRPTEGETFAALERAGLIDRNNPEQSQLLTFIRRKPEKPSLVVEEVRQQELAAFQEWIMAAVKDPAVLAARGNGNVIGPQLPLEVIRHTRKDRVLQSFVENVWSELVRCEHCHSPDFNRGQIARQGQEFVDRISWIVPRDPAATLDRLVDSGLIDVDEPRESLLLQKPTLLVEHKGGLKMVVGDRSYQQFQTFAEDYAASARGSLRTLQDLPQPSAEIALLSKLGLRIDGVPERFGRKVMQVDLFAWDEERKTWSQERCATGMWIVNLQARFWQSPLHLTARRGSPRAANLAWQELPAGRYLARLSVDESAELKRGEALRFVAPKFFTEIEFEASKWQPLPEGKVVLRLPEADSAPAKSVAAEAAQP